MKKFWKNKSLFKNDPLGLKRMIFRIRTDKYIVDSIKIYSKCICKYQLILHEIGIPETKEQEDIIRKILNAYDACVQELERKIKYTRLYVKDETDISRGKM